MPVTAVYLTKGAINTYCSAAAWVGHGTTKAGSSITARMSADFLVFAFQDLGRDVLMDGVLGLYAPAWLVFPGTHASPHCLSCTETELHYVSHRLP